MYHFVIYLINSVGLKICKSLCNRILKHSSNCHKLTNYALTWHLISLACHLQIQGTRTHNNSSVSYVYIVYIGIIPTFLLLRIYVCLLFHTYIIMNNMGRTKFWKLDWNDVQSWLWLWLQNSSREPYVPTTPFSVLSCPEKASKYLVSTLIRTICFTRGLHS